MAGVLGEVRRPLELVPGLLVLGGDEHGPRILEGVQVSVERRDHGVGGDPLLGARSQNGHGGHSGHSGHKRSRSWEVRGRSQNLTKGKLTIKSDICFGFVF